MTIHFDMDRRHRALEQAAASWLRRETADRDEAERQTLLAPNSFTPQALATGIDRAMARVTADALTAWVGSAPVGRRIMVGVLNAGNVPLVGLQDFLAVLATGNRYAGITSRSSPFLLPAFARTVLSYDPTVECGFASLDETLRDVEAVIATGSSATVQLVSRRFADAGVPKDRQLLRGTRTGVALLDGSEDDRELTRLASDVLLHEGRGCRSVSVIFAPSELDPTRFVEQANGFRREFPPHETTLAAMRRSKRFLRAVEASFDEGDGLLLVRDDIPLRESCIVRWIRYVDEGDPVRWLNRERNRVQVVVGSEKWRVQLPTSVDRCGFGEAQDPSLIWRPDGRDTIAFLASLSAAGL